MSEALREHNFFFGYANVDESNPTNFFDYQKVSSDDMKKFNSYLQANKAQTKRRDKWEVNGNKGSLYDLKIFSIPLTPNDFRTKPL